MTTDNDPHRLAVRVKDLENWRHELDTDRAVEAERSLYTSKRFDSIEKRLDKIDSHVSRVVWLIVTAIIVAVMGFMISGGFNVN
jgi:hypothetical protein